MRRRDLDRWTEACDAHVRNALDTASAEVRASWLELFRENECQKCTSPGRATCATTAPVCVPEGGECAQSAVCCAGDGFQAYCGMPGRCKINPTDCLVNGDPCALDGSGPPCCGAAEFNAACVPTGEADVPGVCSNRACSAEAMDACPGCCASIGRWDYAQQAYVGLGLCVQEDQCPVVCSASDSCGLGFDQCVPAVIERDENDASLITAVIDVCISPCPLGASAGDLCGESGCCAKYTGPVGSTILCIPVNDASNCSGSFCDALDPGACFGCGSEPIPNTDGGPPMFSWDRCGIDI